MECALGTIYELINNEIHMKIIWKTIQKSMIIIIMDNYEVFLGCENSIKPLLWSFHSL